MIVYQVLIRVYCVVVTTKIIVVRTLQACRNNENPGHAPAPCICPVFRVTTGSITGVALHFLSMQGRYHGFSHSSAYLPAGLHAKLKYGQFGRYRCLGEDAIIHLPCISEIPVNQSTHPDGSLFYRNRPAGVTLNTFTPDNHLTGRDERTDSATQFRTGIFLIHAITSEPDSTIQT
jgi:hypothetical protein